MSNSAAYLVIKSSRRRRKHARKETSVCVGARGLTLTAPLCLCVVRSEAARRTGAAPKSGYREDRSGWLPTHPQETTDGSCPRPPPTPNRTASGRERERRSAFGGIAKLKDLKKVSLLLCQRLLNCVGVLLRNSFVALNIPT